jgi:nucleoside-diphosphate-sugar epimerase
VSGRIGSPRRVLVTGGQGFVGRHLISRWLAEDTDVHVVAVGRSPRRDDTFTHEVTWSGESVLAPLPTSMRPVDRDRYSYQSIDLIDTDRLSKLLVDAEIDAVVHLAASLRDEPFPALVRNNIEATHSVLEAAVAAGRSPLRVVVGSSGSVYGAVPESALPIVEAGPATPIDLYSVTKRAGEDLASVYRRAWGLDVVVARLFTVIGAGEDERHLAPSLARQFAERQAGVTDAPIQVGPLDTTRDFVDVRDVASALIALARPASDVSAAPERDVVNVASGIESPTQAVYDTLARLSGWPEGSSASRPARQLDFSRQRADIGRLRAVGGSPVHSLADSLETMLRYYLDDVAPAAGGRS